MKNRWICSHYDLITNQLKSHQCSEIVQVFIMWFISINFSVSLVDGCDACWYLEKQMYILFNEKSKRITVKSLFCLWGIDLFMFTHSKYMSFSIIYGSSTTKLNDILIEVRWFAITNLLCEIVTDSIIWRSFECW